MGLIRGLLKVVGIAAAVTGNPVFSVGAFALANQIDKGGRKSGFDKALDAAGSYVTQGQSAYGSTATNALIAGSADYFRSREADEPPAYEPLPAHAASPAYSRAGGY